MTLQFYSLHFLTGSQIDGDPNNIFNAFKQPILTPLGTLSRGDKPTLCERVQELFTGTWNQDLYKVNQRLATFLSAGGLQQAPRNSRLLKNNLTLLNKVFEESNTPPVFVQMLLKVVNLFRALFCARPLEFYSFRLFTPVEIEQLAGSHLRE